jgi:alpha-tubulin suppressor-like RCC1 family protein
VNVNQIEIALSQKIDSSSTDFDLLAASKALQILKTNGVFVVSSYGGLPAAASNEGKIYFIEDIETVVWSNGTEWLRLLDKNTIQFQLWSWGGAFSAATRPPLGDGTTNSSCSPVREFCSATDWFQVSNSNYIASALKSTGEIWSWGSNTVGELGDGTLTNRCSPVREISSSTDWCQVSSGFSHIVAIKTSGELWAWGSNNCGRLGDGTSTNRCSPVREISSSTNWCQVGAGFGHTPALKTDGTLWAWGSNNCGQLGGGTTIPQCSPVREFCSATNWCQVSGGINSTITIKNSGEIWAWGMNSSGQLGDGTIESRCSPVRERCSATNWCQVSINSCNTAALKSNGELWTWGRNQCAGLGDGTVTDRCSPVREITSSTNWCQVSVGFLHGSAIKTSGELWSWGRNDFGQIGDGATITRCSVVREITSSTNWCSVSVGGLKTHAIKIV